MVSRFMKAITRNRAGSDIGGIAVLPCRSAPGDRR
jgi:hypothetical protein